MAKKECSVQNRYKIQDSNTRHTFLLPETPDILYIKSSGKNSLKIILHLFCFLKENKYIYLHIRMNFSTMSR